MIRTVVLFDTTLGTVYGPEQLHRINQITNVYAPIQSAESVKKNLQVLSKAEVIMTGWCDIRFTKEILDAAPKLKAVFYAGGSIRGIVTDEFWKRDILIASAVNANAIPVAQYTVAHIMLCLKNVWRYAHQVKASRNFLSRDSLLMPTAYNAVIGLVSLGAIGRKVCEYLKMFPDLHIMVYDPYLSPKDAQEFDVELCSLEQLFQHSDVISIHAPYLEETHEIIRQEHFESMKPNSSFINTARGGVVHESEMIEVLKSRPDINVVLDVTNPEPPEVDSSLYDLENVMITPHIAGSVGDECLRMGEYMVQELERYITGQHLQWCISTEDLKISS